MHKRVILAASVVVVAAAVAVPLALSASPASAAPLVVSSRIDEATVLNPHTLRVEATLTNISHGTGKTTKCVFVFYLKAGADFVTEPAPRPGRSEVVEADVKLPAGADAREQTKYVSIVC